MALYVGEAIIATSLIVIFLLSVFIFEEVETETNLKEKVFRSLKILDQTNELRKYALENNTESIKNKLASLLPYVEYEVFICKESCLKLKPGNKKTISVSYLLAGDFGKVEPLEVVVMVKE
jgi:hypothetical protein